MKSLFTWLAFPIVPVLAFGMGQQAFSLGQQRASRISGPVAFVSGQRLTAETSDGKAGVARIQALQRERTADLRKKQQALQEASQQLAAQKDPAERKRLQTQEQQLRAEFEKATVQTQVDLQSLQRTVSSEMAGKVRAALDEILKGSDVRVVLNGETALMWAAPGTDLTPTVIEKLEARKASPGAK